MSTPRTVALALLPIAVAVAGATSGTPVAAPVAEAMPPMSIQTPPALAREVPNPASDSEPADRGSVSIEVENPDQLDDVNWALEQYDRLDGEWLPLDIHMHTSKDACGEYSGYHSVSEEGRSQVRVCGDRSILLHELAHAWVAANVGDATRAALLELRGLDLWSRGEWDHRGAEHAAEIIAWGIIHMVNPSYRPTTIPNNAPDELAVAYELLTGHPPLDATDTVGVTGHPPLQENDTVYVEVDRDWSAPTRQAG